MRVVHYHPYMLAGDSGAANAARGWVSAMRSVGVRVLAIVDRDAIHLQPPGGVECIPLAHVGRGRARVPRGLLDVVDEDDVLVLHGGWLLRNAVIGSASTRRNIPFVVMAHGVYDPHVFADGALWKELWALGIERRVLRQALAVHLFFEQEHAGLERLGVRVPTVVVPNGIHTSDIRWDGGSGGYLLWLGRYAIRHKGLDLMIEALHRLAPAARPIVRLHGPDWRGQKGIVRSMVDGLGLGRWVTVGGPVYREVKRDLIGRAAGCIYPSRWEGCSMSVLEALSAGVPTLVTPFAMGRSLGAHEAVVEANWSIDDLAAGIRQLMSPSAAAIGERAAEVARTQFAWTNVASSWLEQVTALSTR
jgi:glycosyltransferase involved in cell wall biosynthesis